MNDLQNRGLPNLLRSDDLLIRDQFNVRKLLVVATATGKVCINDAYQFMQFYLVSSPCVFLFFFFSDSCMVLIVIPVMSFGRGLFQILPPSKMAVFHFISFAPPLILRYLLSLSLSVSLW